MKKFVAIVILVSVILCAVMGAHAAKVNKNRYWVEAYCEQDGGELVFTFCGEEFVWTLGAGDKIPADNIVLLLMDNNGTVGMLEDDAIISYR